MKTYYRLLRYIRPYGFKMTGAVLCMMLFAVTSVFSVGMLLPFLNVLFLESSAGPVAISPVTSVEDLEALEESLPEKVGQLRDEVKQWIKGQQHANRLTEADDAGWDAQFNKFVADWREQKCPNCEHTHPACLWRRNDGCCLSCRE